MPFGSDCEFKDFAACVKHFKGKKDDPEAYCAVLQDKTEDHCKKQMALAFEHDFGSRAPDGEAAFGGGLQRGRRPWTWDPDKAAYLDATGQELDQEEIRGLLARFLEVQRQAAELATARLTSGELTLPEWEQEMRWVLKDSFGASYLLGRGGREAMTSADWGRLSGAVRRQYGFLNDFAAELAAGSVSQARAAQRANLYPLAARQAHSRAWALTQGSPDLPNHPGDGSTECYSNCGCFWTVRRVTLGDGGPGFWAYWNRGKDDSCDTCLRREREWAPLVLRDRAAA